MAKTTIQRDLRPMPCRCGGNAWVGPSSDAKPRSLVYCYKCPASTPAFASEKRAVDVWNAMQSEAKRDHDCT